MINHKVINKKIHDKSLGHIILKLLLLMPAATAGI